MRRNKGERGKRLLACQRGEDSLRIGSSSPPKDMRLLKKTVAVKQEISRGEAELLSFLIEEKLSMIGKEEEKEIEEVKNVYRARKEQIEGIMLKLGKRLHIGNGGKNETK